MWPNNIASRTVSAELGDYFEKPHSLPVLASILVRFRVIFCTFCLTEYGEHFLVVTSMLLFTNEPLSNSHQTKRSFGITCKT